MADSNSVYGTIQPLQGSVSDWVAGQEQNAFRYRAEAREIDRIAQARKDKEQAEYEKRLEKFSLPKFSPTGIKAPDEVLAKVMLKAVDMQGDIYKKLKPGISNEEYASLVMKQKQLNNLPDYLDLAQKSFVNQATSIQKQLADGTVKKDPALLKKLQSFSQGAFDVELDENLTPMMAIYDIDGDGKPDILPYDKIVSGNIFPELVPQVDFTTSFQKLGEKLGSETKTTDKNFVERTIQETPVKMAQLTARGALYDDKGGFTPLAKSKLWDIGVTDFKNVPDKVLNQLENDATQIMLATRDKKDITDIDYGAMNASRRLAFDKSKAKKDETPKPTISYIEPVGGDSPSLSEEFSFSTPYQLKDKKTGMSKEGFISGITTDKTGRIVLKGQENYGKRKKEEDGVEITEDAWRDFTILDKQEVQSILGNVLDTDSYKETLKVLENIKSKKSGGGTGKKETPAERALRIANGG